jgi:endonuclease/exonuclease/phosphatase family metal-dependent hydrolase
MKMFWQISLGVLGFLALFILWCSYPWSLNEQVVETPTQYVEPDEMVETQEFPSVIKVVTFNLGFLYGQGSEGPGYGPRGKEFFLEKIRTLSQELKSWGPDVIFLQEIDFDSSRSHNINQAEMLAKLAGYPYVVMAPSWKANYIPFPYWPLSRQFGAMNSGGAILSKYPLENGAVHLFQKPASQPWWYNLFYLHRYFQTVEVVLGEKRLKIGNLHLEAFDIEDRKNQIRFLSEYVKKRQLHIVAGDYNMLPTGAFKRMKLYGGDNYENDTSFDLMKSSGLSEVVPEEIYLENEGKYFTYPAWKPDRRLDYIYYDPALKMMTAEVLPSAVSDHLPLRASFQISSPRFNPYSL